MDAPWFRFYEPDVPRNLEYPDVTLPDLLDRAAKRFPSHTALRFFIAPGLPSSAMTYREVEEATNRFAAALYGMGVRKGDRVAIMLPNCPQYVVAFYGVLRVGAVVVNTNPLYVAREMKEQYDDSGAETVILLDQFFPRLREIRSATGLKRVILVDLAATLAPPVRALVHLVQWWKGERPKIRAQTDLFRFERLVASHPPSPPRADIEPEDTALFQYTGGTTGLPKAAMLTHRNLVANTMQVAAWFTGTEPGSEIVLAAIPFFHVYGMTTCMLYGIDYGAEVVMIPRPRPVSIVVEVLKKSRATVFPGVPTLYGAINNHPRIGEYDLGSVKLCISGSAPLPTEVQETFERLTGGRLVEGFGMTEASPVTHCNPLRGERKVGSIGLPFPDTDARILDLDTGEPLPPGRDGELVIRGPQVMQGYWNRPEDTAKTIRDGWLHTGDIARMDEDGYFYIVDRMKDMINASGFKIVPREVEEVLYLHPKVEEAVVVGVPDAYRGETVKAFVVLKSGQEATADEIREFCGQHLAAFKSPKEVEFRDELPKSAVGKILRRVLADEHRKQEVPRDRGRLPR